MFWGLISNNIGVSVEMMLGWFSNWFGLLRVCLGDSIIESNNYSTKCFPAEVLPGKVPPLGDPPLGGGSPPLGGQKV